MFAHNCFTTDVELWITLSRSGSKVCCWCCFCGALAARVRLFQVRCVFYMPNRETSMRTEMTTVANVSKEYTTVREGKFGCAHIELVAR